MNRKKLHPKIVVIIKNYYGKEIEAANKILDLVDSNKQSKVCTHKDWTRTSNEYIYCHVCDDYIYYPKINS